MSNTFIPFIITPDAWTKAPDANPVVMTTSIVDWTDGIYIAMSTATIPVPPTIDPSSLSFHEAGFSLSETPGFIIIRATVRRQTYFPLHTLMKNYGRENITGIWYRSAGVVQSITVRDNNDQPYLYLSSSIRRTRSVVVPREKWIDLGTPKLHLELLDNTGKIQIYDTEVYHDGPPPNAVGRVLHGFHDGGYTLYGPLTWARAIGAPATVILNWLP